MLCALYTGRQEEDGPADRDLGSRDLIYRAGPRERGRGRGELSFFNSYKYNSACFPLISFDGRRKYDKKLIIQEAPSHCKNIEIMSPRLE